MCWASQFYSDKGCSSRDIFSSSFFRVFTWFVLIAYCVTVLSILTPLALEVLTTFPFGERNAKWLETVFGVTTVTSIQKQSAVSSEASWFLSKTPERITLLDLKQLGSSFNFVHLWENFWFYFILFKKKHFRGAFRSFELPLTLETVHGQLIKEEGCLMYASWTWSQCKRLL